MKQRRTRQLAAVYDVVMAAHDHDREDVHARVRRALPQVSLGTVLSQSAKARRATAGAGGATGGSRRALRRHDRGPRSFFSVSVVGW